MLVSLFVKTPVSKGTVRVLVGLIAFPVAWIVGGVLAADGALAVTLVVITAAAGALAAIWMVERSFALVYMLLRWQGQRERIGTVALAESVRADVVRHGPLGRRTVMNHARLVAASDCESIRPGLISQPANTVSSLAFVAAAIPIARAARRRNQPAWTGVAVAAAIEGLGSVAYHGPGGRAAKVLHDGGLVALAVAVGRRGRARGSPRGRSPLTAVLTVSAVVLHTLSRTGGPLCSCHSRLQGHAVFHALAAAALVAAAEQR